MNWKHKSANLPLGSTQNKQYSICFLLLESYRALRTCLLHPTQTSIHLPSKSWYTASFLYLEQSSLSNLSTHHVLPLSLTVYIQLIHRIIQTYHKLLRAYFHGFQAMSRCFFVTLTSKHKILFLNPRLSHIHQCYN